DAVLLLASLEDGAARGAQSGTPPVPARAPDDLLVRAEREGGAARVQLLCEAAERAREAGDLRSARIHLRRAGDADPALHALVRLELLAGRPLEVQEGEADDLLPALQLLRERGTASPEELRLLA